MTKGHLRALCLLLGGVSGLGCAGAQGREPPPVGALAESRTAQQMFRAIRQQWAAGARADQRDFEAQLRSFLAAFPDDGEAPLARAYFAFLLIAQARLDEAHEQIAGVLSGPPGAARDAAEVAEGALQLARHRGDLAYERLLPLVGKLIDTSLRANFNRLLVQAAIGSGRAYEAVAFMDAWLRDPQLEDRATSEQDIAQALAAVPTEVLEVTLQTMNRRDGTTGAGYGAAIRKAILVRLAAVALERNDPALARKVVQSGATGSESLEDLASSGAPVVIEGHSIGLILSTGPGPLGVRSADVLAGAVHAVRTGNPKGEDRARLITRDLRDGTRLDLALMTLASQGASILIAGLDAHQATMAARFAERIRIPVILLSSPDEPTGGEYVFVLGEPEGLVEKRLEEALHERGARVVIAVRGPKEPGGVSDIPDRTSSPGPESGMTTMTSWCTRTAPQAGESRFPVRDWREARVDGLLLLADAECGRDAIGESNGLAKTRIPAAVGLNAAQLAMSPPASSSLLVASTGKFPLVAGEGSSPLEEIHRRSGVPPSWSTVLGHDAVALARAALRGLPWGRTDEPTSVSKLHRQVKDTLATAQAELWSADSSGFDGQRTLARTIRIREVFQ